MVLSGLLCGGPPEVRHRHVESIRVEEAFLAAVAEPDTARAIELWSALMKRDGVSASALSERAKRYNRWGRSDLAMRDLAQAVTLNCRKCNANVHYQFASAYSAQRQFDLALEELELAFTYLNQGKDLRAYDVRDHDLSEMKAWIYFEKKMYQDALDSIERAIASSTSCRISRSAMLICLGRGDQAGIDAERLLESAVRTDPDLMNVVVLGYFGFANNGNKDRALRLVRMARDLPGDSGGSLPTLEYLIGQITSHELYRAASDDCKMTDAQCFMALRQLNTGNTTDPPTHLKWIAKNGARDRITFRLALAALNGWPQKNSAPNINIKPLASDFNLP
jgi:tetratricopeptide (TPR) repeat protein